VRSYETFESEALGRRMEILWFGERGYPVLCFPTSQGRFYQYEDFRLVDALSEKIEAGAYQLVCVDSADAESWYNEAIPPAERALRHDAYDRHLRDELVPYVQRRSGRNDVGTFGCSFGAYHAANFTARHPDVVTKAVCLSGIFDVHRWVDPYWDELCYRHSPAEYISRMDDAWVGRMNGIDWLIATGEFDSLVDENRRFIATLAAKNIRVHGEIWRGVSGHDWPFWSENARRLL